MRQYPFYLEFHRYF